MGWGASSEVGRGELGAVVRLREKGASPGAGGWAGRQVRPRLGWGTGPPPRDEEAGRARAEPHALRQVLSAFADLTIKSLADIEEEVGAGVGGNGPT